MVQWYLEPGTYTGHLSDCLVAVEVSRKQLDFGPRLYEYTLLAHMNKGERQQEILNLLEGENISSQEQLRNRLHELGFHVTQATLSRDLRELGVAKTARSEGAYKYTQLDNWRGLLVRSCEASGNLLILHTETGMAPAAAYRIDDLKVPGILGTVAGEDTLLAVVGEGYDARKVRKELWKRVQEM